MDFIYYPAHPLLSECVEFLWLSENYVQAHARERVLPTGTMGIIVDLDTNDGGASIAGARSRPFVLDTSKPLNIMGVGLKPGGGYPFFGPAVGELRDTGVSLDVLWGQRAHDLREQLLQADTPALRFRVLETHLLAQVRYAHARHPGIAHALSAFENDHSVGEVTNAIGLSARKFIDKFRLEVGMTPKIFCRIARFKKVLERVEGCARPDWADIALRAGYYDQAHFNHDFREFAGITPSSYLSDRTSRNHVRLVD